jgi:hypothetical protein
MEDSLYGHSTRGWQGAVMDVSSRTTASRLSSAASPPNGHNLLSALLGLLPTLVGCSMQG